MKYNYMQEENYLSFEYKGDMYSIKGNNDKTITITKNDITNTYKIKEYYHDYVFSIKKTFIGCQCIENLIKHFESCVRDNFAMQCWCVNPLNAVLEQTKPL